MGTLDRNCYSPVTLTALEKTMLRYVAHSHGTSPLVIFPVKSISLNKYYRNNHDIQIQAPRYRSANHKTPRQFFAVG